MCFGLSGSGRKGFFVAAVGTLKAFSSGGFELPESKKASAPTRTFFA
jgi:hypothetical protein